MKICSKCGAQNADDAQFCTGCGGALNEVQGVAFNGGQNPQPVKPPKKKMKTWKIVLIVVAVIVGLIILASAFGGSDDTESSSDANPVSQSDVSEQEADTEKATEEQTQETTAYSSVEEFSISGKGDSLADGLVVTSGCARVHFTHKGSSNFIVQAYDESGSQLLLVNAIGNYDGTVLLPQAGTYDLEIQADGSWSAEASGLGVTSDTSFSGKGDFVTDIFSVSGNKWKISNKNASSNFIVYEYSTLFGYDLLVNEIGTYDGSVRSSISDGEAYFVVSSDGDWSIQPLE